MSLQLGWIPVRRTVSADADVESHDSIEVAVRLLPILDEASLGEILRAGLEERGWQRQPDGTLTKQFGEATATLPADGSVITLAIKAETSVTVSATEDGAAPEDDKKAQDAIEERARDAAARKLDSAERSARRELERKNADELLRVEQDLRKEVAELVNQTTKKALERRATSLGQIDSIEERRGEEGYELTITVKT